MRRSKPERKKPLSDARYNSALLQEFINHLMRRGKRTTAVRSVYQAMELIESRAKRHPLEIFENAVRNAAPMLEVKPRRVGGATYQVPVEGATDRRASLSMCRAVAAARARGGKSRAEKLAGELMDAANNTGSAIKRKEETHKMAEATRAVAHYRW